LAVSQFTLAADCRKGRRPSFDAAEKPERANDLFEHFVTQLRAQGVHVQTGRFGEVMQVALKNEGPVTILLDTERL
jgi:D-tyrosyl-tRNA(Tyr) deacylase